MSLPRYSEYKPSGVAWLGEVPGHWEVKQGRRLYSQKRDSALPTDEQLSATQKYGVVPQRMFMEMEDQKVTLALSGLDNFKHVEKDDFVISLRSFQGGIERSKYLGCVSPAYTVLRPACLIDADFMAYLLKSNGYIAALQTVTDGIRDGKNISYEQFGQIGLPFPMLAEQQAIAAFLDRETGKVDALIAEQQRLVELLAEKRQAVISHAVTKGLNPNARMKDSGVEWLGEVPMHWEVWKLAHAFDVIGSGTTPKSDNAAYYDDGETAWLNTGDLNDGELLDCDKRVTDFALAEHSSLKVYPSGSVVIAMYGATIGKLGMLRFPATVNQACCVFVESKKILPKFLFHWFFGWRQQIVSLATGGGQPNISQEILRGLRLACPPLPEQQTIVTFLDAETAKFDTLTAEANRAIALLQERRSALISAAVTGKIDVRTFVSSSQTGEGKALEAA